MTWKIFEVILRLRSPMHIGCGKIGNLQQTRPYVIGRTFWGAITQRLTRDQAGSDKPSTNSHDYKIVGDDIDQFLSYTYFYPAIKEGSAYDVHFPWGDESFVPRFLGSYIGTALAYPHRVAEEGTLHETEFLSPTAVDTGEPVFLKGYVFEKYGAPNWQAALERIQIGGERGYGWGQVEAVKVSPLPDQCELFESGVTFEEQDGKPMIHLSASLEHPACLYAHTNIAGLNAEGKVEPVVGREWRSTNRKNSYAGQHVKFSGICFVPGAKLFETTMFKIGRFGIWKKVNTVPKTSVGQHNG